MALRLRQPLSCMSSSSSCRFLAVVSMSKRVEKLLSRKQVVENSTRTSEDAFANCEKVLSCVHQKVPNYIEWKFILIFLLVFISTRSSSYHHCHP